MPDELKMPDGQLPAFESSAELVGVSFQRFDDTSKLHRIMESNGGGVALIDFDADGWLDVFFTNGCSLPRQPNDRQHSDAIFQNDGTGRFRAVTDRSMLESFGYHYGCAVGDYDGDGFDDLYVTAFGKNSLWHNQGDGSFIETTQMLESRAHVWSSSAAFGDLNRDGHLDLYVANYVQTSDDPPELCPVPHSPDGVVTCPPTVFHAENDVLYLSNADGTFRDATVDCNIDGSDGKGLGVLIFDADRDGWQDIYVANDGMPNFLYVNNQAPANQHGEAAPPTFRESGASLGVSVNSQGKAEASMGIAYGDTDRDGWGDLLVTHFLQETNTFYRNLGGTGFADETRASGLGPPSRGSLDFGTEFLDFDNDGWLDLFVAAGHVDDLRWDPVTPLYEMPAKFYRNERGKSFTDVSSWSGDYFKRHWLGRGVAKGDIDNDGNIDLVVSHQLSPSEVLLNKSDSPCKSIVLKLVGLTSNRSAVGARVNVVQEGSELPIVREVAGGGSYQSASDVRIHLGLGELRAAQRLQIQWPSGSLMELGNVQPGRYAVVEGNNDSLVRINR